MGEFLAAIMALAILVAPLFLLPTVVDFVLGNRPLRAIARRLFRIDPTATVVNLPELANGTRTKTSG